MAKVVVEVVVAAEVVAMEAPYSDEFSPGTTRSLAGAKARPRNVNRRVLGRALVT